jgi:hypothetical protein
MANGRAVETAYRTWISAVGLGGRPKRWLRQSRQGLGNTTQTNRVFAPNISPASDLIGVGATCGLLEKEVGQFRCQTLAKASMAASRVVTADGEDAA